MAAQQQRRAVIDVGTNSVKLLIADINGLEVCPLLETSEQTRLGRGFYVDHRLRAEAIEQTARVIADYAAEARRWRAEVIRAIATSAARDAINQGQLQEAIRSSSGLEMETISGEQEAEWAFQGVASDPRFSGHPVLLADVGGGSSQFVLGKGVECNFRHSFRVGTVRLFESVRPQDPPSADDWARCHRELNDTFEQRIIPRLVPALRRWAPAPIVLVGTGGTCSLLAAMQERLEIFDRERIESVRLGLTQLQRQRHALWKLPLAERKKLAGLPPKKADVILTGIAIYVVLMEALAFRELCVSTRGFRFGALLASPGHVLLGPM
jgi:exopolyphosphatase/guanosine-5'-triphosphate,3'-diphosphate pyrophosphatase